MERRRPQTTLRSEIEALQRMIGDEYMPWMALDAHQRDNICKLLTIALRAPDTAPEEESDGDNT